VILSQGFEVESLGFQGIGSLRDNLTQVRLGTFATRHAAKNKGAVEVGGLTTDCNPIMIDDNEIGQIMITETGRPLTAPPLPTDTATKLAVTRAIVNRAVELEERCVADNLPYDEEDLLVLAGGLLGYTRDQTVGILSGTNFAISSPATRGYPVENFGGLVYREISSGSTFLTKTGPKTSEPPVVKGSATTQNGRNPPEGPRYPSEISRPSPERQQALVRNREHVRAQTVLNAVSSVIRLRDKPTVTVTYLNKMIAGTTKAELQAAVDWLVANGKLKVSTYTPGTYITEPMLLP
jgi:hypothetical protein